MIHFIINPINEYSIAPILIPIKKHRLSNENDPVCKIHCDGGSHLATSSDHDTDTPYLGRTLTLGRGRGADFEEPPFKTGVSVSMINSMRPVFYVLQNNRDIWMGEGNILFASD